MTSGMRRVVVGPVPGREENVAERCSPECLVVNVNVRTVGGLDPGTTRVEATETAASAAVATATRTRESGGDGRLCAALNIAQTQSGRVQTAQSRLANGSLMASPVAENRSIRPYSAPMPADPGRRIIDAEGGMHRTDRVTEFRVLGPLEVAGTTAARSRSAARSSAPCSRCCSSTRARRSRSTGSSTSCGASTRRGRRRRRCRTSCPSCGSCSAPRCS